MTPYDISLIRESFSLAVAKKNSVTALFYEDLFRTAPHLRELFPDDMHAQRDILLHALSFCVRHLDQMDVLLPLVRDIAIRHRRYGVEPEHFPVVLKTLIKALDTTFEVAFSPPTEQAWRMALTAVAEAMLDAAYPGETRLRA